MRNMRRIVLVTSLLIVAAARQGQYGAVGPPPPQVTVGTPLQETVATTTDFLGQFSAVGSVDLRAQVGGTLAEFCTGGCDECLQAGRTAQRLPSRSGSRASSCGSG